MITVKHVNKSYGNHQVLYDIQAAFEPGRVYGIVGENGAGKTTFFKCLLGLETHEGQVESKWQPLKDHLGWLPTESYFFPYMTGREYLQLVCNARKTELGDATEKNIFDLPLDEFAVHYSTGMKKKLELVPISWWSVRILGFHWWNKAARPLDSGWAHRSQSRLRSNQ